MSHLRDTGLPVKELRQSAGEEGSRHHDSRDRQRDGVIEQIDDDARCSVYPRHSRVTLHGYTAQHEQPSAPQKDFKSLMGSRAVQAF